MTPLEQSARILWGAGRRLASDAALDVCDGLAVLTDLTAHEDHRIAAAAWARLQLREPDQPAGEVVRLPTNPVLRAMMGGRI